MSYDDDFGEAAFEARMERERFNEFGETEGVLECGHGEDDCDCEDAS